MAWASYALKFELESEAAGPSLTVYVTKTFTLKTMIFQEVAVHAGQTNSWNPPTAYPVSDGYPVAFPPLNTNDHPIVHIQIDS